jgi:ATP-dependent DNA helicase RecG
MESVFESSLEELLNLKTATLNNLKRLGILNLRDLLFHLPYSYVTKKIDPDLRNVVQEDAIITTVKIIQTPNIKDKIKKFVAQNQLGQNIELLFFSKIPKFIGAYFKLGATVTLQGRVNFFLSEAQMTHPDIVFNKNLIKQIEPVYGLTQGLSNAQLHKYILYCINLLPNIKSWHSFEQKLNLPSIRESLINIHDPADLELIEIYNKRMALEELLINQFLLSRVRKKNKISRCNSIIDHKADNKRIVLQNLGFTATDQQLEVLEEIKIDQLSSARMTRMLQGDVGCGKTFVALMSMLDIIKIGKQCCLMAPTEILSIQHFNFFSKALENTGIKVAILTGSIKGQTRKALLKDLEECKIDILIGTHALFQEKIIFANLGYVIIDEQHRFGVKQRLELLSKAEAADLLLMTATPIPRSLNLVLYGDMDVSYLRTKPKNNLPIITRIVSDNKIDELALSLRNIIDKGQQIYWICPLIQESEHKNFTNVTFRYEFLKSIYGDFVGLVHGGMTQDEKDGSMNDFKNGITKLLVATTVIEVGIDVPNATLIVIEDSQAFGLSQLHQLRGRVGRSNLQSYCMLVYKSKSLSEVGKARLNIIKSSNDGFEISEQDLSLRGAGDVVGLRQSGRNSFVFSNLVNHSDLLELAKEFIESNPDLIPSQEVIKLFDKEHILDEWIIA